MTSEPRQTVESGLEESLYRAQELAEPSGANVGQTSFSDAAVSVMRTALIAGGGRMAQFAHPEFGGFGQWMQGGMVMTAAHDSALEQRIDRLCEALRIETFADAPDERNGRDGNEPDALDDAAGLSDPGHVAAPSGRLDPFVALEKLAALHARGIVTSAEYAAKKAELLARI